MTWLWAVGGLVLLAGAVLPGLLARRRAGRDEYVAARDRARSAMSRLEWALDAAGAEPAGDGPGGDESNGGSPVGDGAHGRGGIVAGPASDPGSDPVAEARRCFTLAGSALAGTDTVVAFRQAESWARQGLSVLGVPADDPDPEHGTAGGEPGPR